MSQAECDVANAPVVVVRKKLSDADQQEFADVDWSKYIQKPNETPTTIVDDELSNKNE